MLRLLFVLLVWMLPCQGALLLKNQLQKAEKGDYLVTLQCKNYTLLSIHEKGENRITIDEMTLPQGKSIGSSWRDWAEKGAPGNTGWVRMTFNTDTGVIINSTHSLTKQESFLPTLLNLKLDKISAGDRKRVGPRGNTDIPDRRRVWNPPLFFEGKKVEGIQFDAWRTRWPDDRSELSNKIITVYLPEESAGYPVYFPYWLQVQAGMTKTHLQVIDSGRNLKTPKF